MKPHKFGDDCIAPTWLTTYYGNVLRSLEQTIALMTENIDSFPSRRDLKNAALGRVIDAHALWLSVGETIRTRQPKNIFR